MVGREEPGTSGRRTTATTRVLSTRRPDHYRDVDEDGFVDLVSHYRIGDIGLELTDTEACLTGVTLDGIPIEGCDSVRVFWRNR